MKEMLMEALVDGVGIILLGLITYLSNHIAMKIGDLIEDKEIGEELKNKQYLAKIVVNAIEQIYVEEDGPAKYELAKERLVMVARENHVNISTEEIEMFIEDAYKAMREGINYGKN